MYQFIAVIKCVQVNYLLLLLLKKTNSLNYILKVKMDRLKPFHYVPMNDLLGSSRIFDYFLNVLPTFYVILKRCDVTINTWKVFYSRFQTFWWLNERSGSRIKWDINRQSLKKLRILGSESWNDSFGWSLSLW